MDCLDFVTRVVLFFAVGYTASDITRRVARMIRLRALRGQRA